MNAPRLDEGSEREAFEAEIRKDAGDLSTFGSGVNLHYRNSAVNNAWGGWKARAALSTGRLGGEAEGDDARRLVWAMDNMGLNLTSFAFMAHVLARGGTGDYSDCVTFIDARMPPAPAAKPQGDSNA